MDNTTEDTISITAKKNLVQDLNEQFPDWHFAVDKDTGQLSIIYPRDDTFLPASVSNEYYNDVLSVIDFGCCTKEEAIDALAKTNNDVLAAIKIFNPDF